VIQTLGDSFEWFERVSQHGQVNFHLLPIQPTFEKARLLVKRSEYYVGNLGHLAEQLCAAILV
jgi:hypothetical protein